MKNVDLSGPIYAQYKRARKRAEDAEKQGALHEAASAYRQSAELMRQYAQTSRDAKIRQQRMERAEALDEVAQRLARPGSSGFKPQKPGSPTTQAAEATGEDDYETAVLELIQRTSIKWDDIGGLEDTKQAIKAAYGLALARKPQGVEISSWRNFLLYGPPGTGKTILAAATAGSLDATFFNVKVSSLLSKYFGESSKLLSTLYTVARRLEPSVIFLDEFESLTPPRGSGESGAERRIVSTFLAELDGLATKEDPSFILTIGATNVPWLLDTAILSRFQRRIYVPLPDEAARLVILEIHLTRRGHKSQVSMAELAQRTAGFSGREIEQLCQTAITHMIQHLNPTLMDAVDKGQEAVRNYEIRVEPLTEADFKVAFDQINPITSPEMLKAYERWAQKAEG
jgi:SpoVK/Ycf46/Vps4 family AAA+-type ATPase